VVRSGVVGDPRAGAEGPEVPERDGVERGVYRTRDGGPAWDHVLAIDNEVGVIELVMNPKDPAILNAAAYDKERTAVGACCICGHKWLY
jgi:hypothetical protein